MKTADRDDLALRRAQRAIQTNPDVFQPAFAAWLIVNWWIFVWFEEMTDRLWENEIRRYSARGIIDAMHYRYDLEKKGKEKFKVNNKFAPDIARLYTLLRPARTGFFEFRTWTDAAGAPIRAQLPGRRAAGEKATPNVAPKAARAETEKKTLKADLAEGDKKVSKDDEAA